MSFYIYKLDQLILPSLKKTLILPNAKNSIN